MERGDGSVLISAKQWVNGFITTNQKLNPQKLPFASYRYSKVIHRRRGEHARHSPQPSVNNFGVAEKMLCEKPTLLLNQQVEHAGAGRRILRSNVATFSQRLSLRHPAPCRKGTLRTLRLQVQTVAETNLYKPFHPPGLACSITQPQTLS